MALVEYGSDLDDTGQTHGASNMHAAFTPYTKHQQNVQRRQ